MEEQKSIPFAPLSFHQPSTIDPQPIVVAAVWIADIFVSTQGEGLYSGVRSTFVRTSGCNLRCRYCDTPYTSWSPEGRMMTLDQILHAVEQAEVEHVVVTGGEPMLQSEVVPLTHELARRKHLVTIETAGTVDQPVTAHLMSISPKRPNSDPPVESGWTLRHRLRQHQPEVIRRLLSDYDYQLKFVIDQPADLDDVAEYLLEFPEVPPERVWLMPQGTDRDTLEDRTSWLEEASQSRGYRFCPRLHIELYGNTRGT